MKKIFSVLISLSVFLSVVSVSAETTTRYDENKWNLLVAIDTVDDADFVDVAEECITKGDYVIYLMRLFARDDEVYVGDSLFSDVTSSEACYDAANIAKQMGCCPELEFSPREDITCGEAVQMLVRGMGYSSKFSGAAAPKLPSLKADKKMTMNDMTELFYSAVHEPLLKYDISFGSQVTYKVDDGKTILSEYHNIEIIDGIVTSNGITSLYSEAMLPDGGIEIDEVYYGDANKLGKEYLGYNVRAYVDFTDDKDSGNLVYISNDRTEVTVIDSFEIQSVNDRVTQITYVVNNRNKTSKIHENAKVIYNGKFFGDYKNSDLMPENGTVTLIDNDRDGTADSVRVWSYETMFVDYVSSGSKTVYNKYKQSSISELCLDEFETEYTYEIFWDGDALTVSDIKKNQVLSVARSKNETDGYMLIEVSKNEFNGKIQTVDRAESKIRINDTWYQMLPEFKNEYSNIVLSNSYVFYADSFGRIAAMEIDNKEVSFIYAYLFKAYENEDDETAMLKVFTEEADWMKYDVKTNVSYNGKSVKPNELLYGVKGDSGRSGFIAGGETVRQVIKLKTDGNNVVSVETAKVGGTFDEFNKFTGSLAYRGQDKSFDNKYFINKNTVIFGIPTDEPENEDAYIVRPTISWDRSYKVSAYGVDEFGDAAVLEVGVSSLRKTIATCLVTDIIEGIGSDGDVSVMLRCSFGIFGQFDIAFDENVDYSTINRGDIIRATINEVGKIISFVKKYDYATQAGKLYCPAQYHADVYLSGKIVKIDAENRRMIVNLGENRPNQGIRLNYGDLIVKRYNRKNKKVDVVSINSLETGDYVVLDNRASYTFEVIVYEE